MASMSFIRLAGIVLAGAGVVSGLGSAPLQVALVEEVSGHPVGAQFMDYVEPGNIIRLEPRDKVVLGYLRSCIRKITRRLARRRRAKRCAIGQA